MPDPFTLERFLPHVGEVFHVVKEDGAQMPVLLSEVTRLASDDSPRRIREPFSLVFHASPETRLEQRIYRIENAGMDPFDCFLVAIGPDAYGMRFEAVYT